MTSDTQPYNFNINKKLTLVQLINYIKSKKIKIKIIDVVR